MFIIFYKDTKQILSYGHGIPTESGNVLYLGSEAICNDLSRCGWKYIADQKLERDETGIVHDADYYETVTPGPTEAERLATVEDLLAALVEG